MTAGLKTVSDYLFLPSLEPQVYDGGAGRKTVVGLPNLGHVALFQPPQEREELPGERQAEVVEFRLVPVLRYSGYDTWLVDQTLEAARAEGVGVVSVPVMGTTELTLLECLRGVPPADIEISERIAIPVQGGVQYGEQSLEGKGVGWLAGHLVERESLLGPIDPNNADAEPPFVVDIKLN